MNFETTFSLHVIQAFLIFTRLAAFIFVGPLFNLPQISLRFKSVLVLSMTLIIIPVVPETWSVDHFESITMFTIILLMISEILLGLMVAMIVRMMMEILALGGFLIDRDMGYAMTSMFAPGAMGGQTVMSLLFVQIFLILFLVHDGHHDFIRLAAASFHDIGPGEFIINGSMADSAIELGGGIFKEGFRVSLPVFAVIMTINLAMALITKFAEEFQVMMLSFPIRLAVGLFVIINMLTTMIVIIRGFVGDMLDLLQIAVSGG